MATRTPSISDVAVKAKTGKTWGAWRKTLDAAGAKAMDHAAIAKMVAAKFNLSGWWAQCVTVEYELMTGKRARHQKKDGFSASVSKTLAVATASMFKLFDHDATRRRLLGQTVTFSTRRANKTLRFAWPGGGRVVIAFYPKAARKTQVTFQHEKLAAAKDVIAMKKFWAGVVAKAEKLAAN
ncbi:MAG: hypothetical protein SFV19_09815 [Rhodospirillaceae bacterium]|nr:hypothetical protein [Rhodospirillaceae bacterium]